MADSSDSLSSSASSAVSLTITTGTKRIKKEIPASQLQSLTIGRGADATLFLNDPGISRKHCRIYRNDDGQPGATMIEDLGSSGGTWVNGERLSAPTILHDGDQLQLGGVKIEVALAGERAAAAEQATIATPPPLQRPAQSSSPSQQQPPSPNKPPPTFKRPMSVSNPDATIAAPARHATSSQFSSDGLLASVDDAQSSAPEDDISISLDRDTLIIGRDASCDLPLDNLMISRQHARVFRVGPDFVAEDLNSTNGTFLNNQRLTHPQRLTAGDALGIGPYCLIFDGTHLSSERPETGAQITLREITQEVRDRETGQPKFLLQNISFTIRPRQFVGLLGTSGAGKSTFVGAISGRRPASSGAVLLNGENLYQRFEALKAGIGFVPQDVIFHDSLPLIEALRYTSRLRLSKDASDEEIEANLERVLKTVGLSENRGTIIKNLSGGQKKRVSIAMELLSQPRVLFLDEVTSGLDPRTEKQMMKLFRELADSGITVICITHYANSVEICDSITYLNKGMLVFYGSPAQFKEYFNVTQIEAAYDQEDQKSPAQWQADFKKSPLHGECNADSDAPATTGRTRRSHTDRNWIDWPQLRRQLSVLTQRYVRILSIDRRNLLLLLGLPPLAAVLLCILADSMENSEAAKPPVLSSAAFGYWFAKHNILCFGPIIIMFLLSMFGSVREIVKELSIYHHERFINLRIVPYLLSKMGPLAVIGAVQTLSVVLIVNIFADMHAGNIIAQFVTLFLISLCGMLAGLAISASVKSSDWAVMLMIAVVIPQLLFSGAMGELHGAAAFIGKGFVSSYWARESLKSNVQDYFISDHLGSLDYYDFHHLQTPPEFAQARWMGRLHDFTPEAGQSWAMGTFMLTVHIVAYAMLTFFLLAQKDGKGTLQRIGRSIQLLFEETRQRLTAKRAMQTSPTTAAPAIAASTSAPAAAPAPSGRDIIAARRAVLATVQPRLNPAEQDGHPNLPPKVSPFSLPLQQETPHGTPPFHSSGGSVMPRILICSVLLGVFLGYPLSYFFQPAALQQKVPLGSYISHISDVMKERDLSGTALGVWFGSILVFAIIGFIIGTVVDSGRRNGGR